MSTTGPTAPPLPLFLDCDTGVDDAVALGYLLASPEVDLVGIGTVSGNTTAVRAARNTLDLLALAGRSDVPVAVGEHDPLAGSYAGGAPHVHGEDGVGGVDLAAELDREAGRRAAQPVAGSAAELLVRTARAHPGQLRVLAVGPLTNLARALQLDPDLPGLVHGLTVMGGSALAPGNITPVAEANIGNDPEAAAAVLAAPWPVTLVPLDVTLDHVLEEEDRQRLLAAPSAVPQVLGRVLDHYFDFYVGTYGRRCCALHDPLAAALAVGGATASLAPRVPVVVDTTHGPGRGQTICDLRGARLGHPDVPGAHVRVVLSVAEPLREHLVDRLTGGG